VGSGLPNFPNLHLSQAGVWSKQKAPFSLSYSHYSIVSCFCQLPSTVYFFSALICWGGIYNPAPTMYGDFKSLLTLVIGVGHTNPKGLGRIKPVMTIEIFVAPTNPLGQKNKS